MVESFIAAPASESVAAAPGSTAWHYLRRTGIGGSDAAAALGLSPWRSAYELYLDKLGELEHAEPNPAMLWGKRLEPTILQEYSDATGRRVATPRSTFRSVAFPYMIANLDGLAEGRVVEAKNVRTADGWGEAGSDVVPLVYMLQVQHYMLVTALPVADIAVLIGGADFRIYEVPADADLQGMLVAGESEFWQSVTRGEPPQVVSVEDARKRWGSLAVRGNVEATAADADLVTALHLVRAQMETLTAEAQAAKLLLMKRLGETGDAIVDAKGHALVTWRLARAPMRFDAEAFEREHADLYHSYLRPGKPSRRFLLKD